MPRLLQSQDREPFGGWVVGPLTRRDLREAGVLDAQLFFEEHHLGSCPLGVGSLADKAPLAIPGAIKRIREPQVDHRGDLNDGGGDEPWPLPGERWSHHPAMESPSRRTCELSTSASWIAASHMGRKETLEVRPFEVSSPLAMRAVAQCPEVTIGSRPPGTPEACPEAP